MLNTSLAISRIQASLDLWRNIECNSAYFRVLINPRSTLEGLHAISERLKSREQIEVMVLRSVHVPRRGSRCDEAKAKDPLGRIMMCTRNSVKAQQLILKRERPGQTIGEAD